MVLAGLDVASAPSLAKPVRGRQVVLQDGVSYSTVWGAVNGTVMKRAARGLSSSPSWKLYSKPTSRRVVVGVDHRDRAQVHTVDRVERESLMGEAERELVPTQRINLFDRIASAAGASEARLTPPASPPYPASIVLMLHSGRWR